jgi:Cu/Ag efflux pump CusA
VSQVIATGGDQKQYEVVVEPTRLRAYGVTVVDVEQALSAANRNATAGFPGGEGQEYLIRGLGRFTNVADIGPWSFARALRTPVLVRDLAEFGKGRR